MMSGKWLNSVMSVDTVPVFNGIESVQAANRRGTGCGQGRCTGHDNPVVGWYCPQKKFVRLRGEIECDEVYLVVGHKGYPEGVAKVGRPHAAVGSKVSVGAEHWQVRNRLSWA
jgi:hypothetical protein